jgi:hypothetical protein
MFNQSGLQNGRNGSDGPEIDNNIDFNMGPQALTK